MITILYIYKNKDLHRVQKSLDSLRMQFNNNFKVLFVDYGSSLSYSEALQELLRSYSFVASIYSSTLYEPWSRSKAINVGLKNIDTPYVFVADIDMIFRGDFVEKLYSVAQPSVSTYFKVGFLDKKETILNKPFETYFITHVSTEGAQGLSLFPTQHLKDIGGFDELYHFWGAEDADVHVRFQNAGYSVEFYSEDILMLHQWHPSYRSTESEKLTQDLQLSGVVKFNHQHLKEAIRLEKTKVNDSGWGKLTSKQDFERLKNIKKMEVLTNSKEVIDHFLFFTLYQYRDEVIQFQFVMDPMFSTVKYKIKKILGKNVPQPYSLKYINDQLLLHLICFHSQKNYHYRVAPDLKSIYLTL